MAAFRKKEEKMEEKAKGDQGGGVDMRRGAPDVFERRTKSRRCGLESKYHYQDRQTARLDG